MKNFLILIMLLTFNQLISQEKIGLKEIYVDNNLAYKVSDNTLFSGIAQKVRKNGHLVYDEKYENGIIIESHLYYNQIEKTVSDEIIYNHNKPFVFAKKTRFGFSTDWKEITLYDENGNKIKFEKYEKSNLIYSCEYLNNKKNGIEYTLCENGDEQTVNYINGKKQK